MDQQHDYIRDISEMRSMMERSARFLSLSGWSGVMAGVYGLVGSYLAYSVFGFNPQEISAAVPETRIPDLLALAVATLILSIATVIYFSKKRAACRGEKLWNPTSRRLLSHMMVPLAAGGILSVIFLSKGLTGLLAPTTLIFYGVAMFNAAKFTFEEIRVMGLVEIALGLTAAWFTAYGLLLWAVGFGAVHIVYGIYLHYKYER